GGCPAVLRGFGVGDGLFDFRLAGEGDLGLHLAGIWVEHVAEASGGALHLFAADEMADFTHGFILRLDCCFLRKNELWGLICGDFCSFPPAGHGFWARQRPVFPSRSVSLYRLLTAP